MRSLILIFTLFISLSFNSAFGSQNYLNEIVLENGESGYNVILRVDSPVRVKKTIASDNIIILSMKNIVASKNITTLYKNIPNANAIQIENMPDNDIQIKINANSIAGANVILNTPNSAPLPIGDKFAKEKMIWSIFSIAFIMISIYAIKTRDRRIVRKMNMRDREIEFYKATLPSISYRPQYLSVNSLEKSYNKNFKTLRQYQDLSKV